MTFGLGAQEEEARGKLEVLQRADDEFDDADKYFR